MNIKVLKSTKNNEFGNLSIDEQKMIVGGVSQSRPIDSYEGALGEYAAGKASISSSGDIVTFTPLLNPFNKSVVEASKKDISFGIGVSYKVQGDNAYRLKTNGNTVMPLLNKVL